MTWTGESLKITSQVGHVLCLWEHAVYWGLRWPRVPVARTPGHGRGRVPGRGAAPPARAGARGGAGRLPPGGLVGRFRGQGGRASGRGVVPAGGPRAARAAARPGGGVARARRGRPRGRCARRAAGGGRRGAPSAKTLKNTRRVWPAPSRGRGSAVNRTDPAQRRRQEANSMARVHGHILGLGSRPWIVQGSSVRRRRG